MKHPGSETRPRPGMTEIDASKVQIRFSEPLRKAFAELYETINDPFKNDFHSWISHRRGARVRGERRL
jgi:hypothetical protein